MSVMPRRGGETYAEQCIQKQQNKSRNGECQKDINECVRKGGKCVNYNDSEKMTTCYRDAINWADTHCNSQPDHRQPDHRYPDNRQPDHRQPEHRQPDHRQRHLRGETYAKECIQQAKSSGHNYSQEHVMKCLTHKCFNLHYDSDTIQKCANDGVDFVQNNYDNSDFYGVY